MSRPALIMPSFWSYVPTTPKHYKPLISSILVLSSSLACASACVDREALSWSLRKPAGSANRAYGMGSKPDLAPRFRPPGVAVSMRSVTGIASCKRTKVEANCTTSHTLHSSRLRQHTSVVSHGWAIQLSLVMAVKSGRRRD